MTDEENLIDNERLLKKQYNDVAEHPLHFFKDLINVWVKRL